MTGGRIAMVWSVGSGRVEIGVRVKQSEASKQGGSNTLWVSRFSVDGHVHEELVH